MNQWIKIVTITILIGIIQSCTEEPPKWTQKEFSEEDISYSTINLNEIKINGIPVYSDLKIINEAFGKPIDTLDSYSFSWAQQKARHSGQKHDSIHFVDYGFKNIRAISSQGITKIYFISLFNSDIKVETEYGMLTENTTLTEIKKIAPESYSWRNLGVSRYSGGYGQITKEDYENGNVTGLIFDSGLDSSHDDVEMVFNHEKLIYINIGTIDLQYEQI